MKAKNKVLLDRYETSRPPFEPPNWATPTVLPRSCRFKLSVLGSEA